MATFLEANLARTTLKMKLSNYSWYNWSTVIVTSDGFSILINVKRINNSIRKIIPPIITGVITKVEVE